MNIDELTIGQVKELSKFFSEPNVTIGQRKHPFEVGENWFIRTVTHHLLGHVVEVCDLCVVMDNCAWIADDGRFAEAMQGKWGNSAEHEPFPPEKRVPVFFSAMIDAMPWDHQLVVVQK